jgi:disintegrin and metalloproteinase domain-containing protein 10
LAEVRGLVTEDGLFDGTISTQLEDFYIEPVSRYVELNGSKPHFHTIVYRSSDVYSSQLAQPCASQLLHLGNSAPRETTEGRAASSTRTNLPDDGIQRNREINDERKIKTEKKRPHGKGPEIDVTESTDEEKYFEINENRIQSRSSKLNLRGETLDKEQGENKINTKHKIYGDKNGNVAVSNIDKTDRKSEDVIDVAKTLGSRLDRVSRSHKKIRSRRWVSDEEAQPRDSSYHIAARRDASRLDAYYYNPNVFYESPNGSVPSTDATEHVFSARHVHKRATIDPKKTTCMLYLQADHLFYQKYGTEEACIEVMTRHVQRVNSIYKATGKLCS